LTTGRYGLLPEYTAPAWGQP